MNRTRTIVRTCSLLTVLMLVACARPSPLSSDPGSTSAIAMCGGGLDDGVTAAVEAEFERLSVRGITEFRRSVKAILNANDVSNEKYDRYIKCVLEIHRVRLEVESDHKEAEACKDRCTSLNDSCQANNRKTVEFMFDVSPPRLHIPRTERLHSSLQGDRTLACERMPCPYVRLVLNVGTCQGVPHSAVQAQGGIS